MNGSTPALQPDGPQLFFAVLAGHRIDRRGDPADRAAASCSCRDRCTSATQSSSPHGSTSAAPVDVCRPATPFCIGSQSAVCDQIFTTPPFLLFTATENPERLTELRDGLPVTAGAREVAALLDHRLRVDLRDLADVAVRRPHVRKADLRAALAADHGVGLRAAVLGDVELHLVGGRARGISGRARHIDGVRAALRRTALRAVAARIVGGGERHSCVVRTRRAVTRPGGRITTARDRNASAPDQHVRFGMRTPPTTAYQRGTDGFRDSVGPPGPVLSRAATGRVTRTASGSRQLSSPDCTVFAVAIATGNRCAT